MVKLSVQKRVVDVTQGLEVSSRRFLYDGWNVVAEYAAPGGSVCGALLRSYTWGLDIVNTQANAGGVGALLQIADHPSGKCYLPTYDGNGNVAALVNASSGALAACYEYSPYGEPLRAQTLDSTVADNPFRFSTKYTDVETGLVYYGHRYYDPKNGRFINRDPIEESGGLNLYGFCRNDAVNRWDYLGFAVEKPKLNQDGQSGGDWNAGDTYTNNGVNFTVGDGIYGFGGYAGGDGLSASSGSGSTNSSLGLGSGNSGTGLGGGNIGDGGSGGDGPGGGGVVLSSDAPTAAPNSAGTGGDTLVNATTVTGAATTSAGDGAAATATVIVVTPSVTAGQAGADVGLTTATDAVTASAITGSPLVASSAVDSAAVGTADSASSSQPVSTGAPNSAGRNTITVNQTTFIPQSSISDPLGATYADDGRNLWQSGTNRSTQTVVIDTNTHAVVSTTNNIGTSVRLSPFPSSPTQSTGSFGVSSQTNSVSGITTVTITGSVTNNAFVLRPIPSPSIEYRTTVTIFNNGSVSVQVSHDGFPAYETRVNGQPVYGYDPRATNTGAGALWPPMDKNSGNVPVP